MTDSKVKTVTEYLGSLSPDRKKAITAIRRIIRKNLPKGFKETMNWGMIAYEVPLDSYPNTYNGKPLLLAAIASQKNHMAIYLMCLYGNKGAEKEFRDQFTASGKKLDFGKSCIRFKKLEDLPLEVIGKTIASVSLEKFLTQYEKTHRPRSKS